MSRPLHTCARCLRHIDGAAVRVAYSILCRSCARDTPPEAVSPEAAHRKPAVSEDLTASLRRVGTPEA